MRRKVIVQTSVSEQEVLDVNSDANLIFMVNDVMYRWILYLW